MKSVGLGFNLHQLDPNLVLGVWNIQSGVQLCSIIFTSSG